ncbi:hypothetical protein [Nostoc cycadae]|uniref:hypothetical protein n=1 Tax=Nostoc cycadae TaxID=246795 RepID=UPI000CCBF441|nr:hypothetical protein [Nostoc cycadae]
MSLSKFFTASINQPKKQRPWGWISLHLTLSLGFAIFYSILGLQRAFKTEYVAQDDAREYVFWMQQFIDPELFQHDLIADYFQSITPLGYATLYKLMANFGINPLLCSKLIPVFLCLITTIYCFNLSLEIFPVPGSAFITTLLLNQSLWFQSDLVSATPRSFIYPLLLAFLYYLIRCDWRINCLIIMLAGLFYPPLVFICIGILLIRLPNNYFGLVTILGLAFLVMLPYLLASSKFAPVVTANQAWIMPELWTEGRHPFFDNNLARFWLIGQHSGILPPLMPPLIWMGLFFPLVRGKLEKLTIQVKILPQIIIVSLTLFFAAHALLLKLFFPTRYTVHTFRIVMAIAAGITLTVILERLFHAYQQKRRLWQITLAVSLITFLLLYPNFSGRFPTTDYRQSTASALYKFLQQQPKDTLVATLSDEADNIPTFAQRPILVGREYALPFHLGYYSQIRQRIIDLLHAQYSQDLTPAKQLIQKYGVDFWLIENTSFQVDYLIIKPWLKSFQPGFNEAISNLSQNKIPALATLTKNCSVLETENFILLKADCILEE